jgi:hypothetical protein
MTAHAIMDAPLIGARHTPHAGQETTGCLCGCQWVEGHVGYVVQDSDTPKLRSMKPPMVYVAFDLPRVGGRAGTYRVVVAYEVTEAAAMKVPYCTAYGAVGDLLLHDEPCPTHPDAEMEAAA